MAQQTAKPVAKSARSESEATARNPELDFARGLALLAAVVVVCAPLAELLPAWLAPSVWNGATVADVLPATFATVAGVSIAFQWRRNADRSWPWWVARGTRRLLVLAGLGVALVFLLGTPGLTISLDTLRWTDHLTRIGVASVLAIPLVRLPRWGEITIATGLLAAHSMVLVSTGLELTPVNNGMVGLDQQLLGAAHALGPIDPNGITALAPTVTALLVGFWIGEWLSHRGRSAATSGVLLLLAGWVGLVAWSWHQVVPANATLWTGPIVAAGISATLVLLALGHAGTRWGPTDRLVATVGVAGQVSLPLWIAAALAGRWVVTLGPVQWFTTDALGALVTPAVASLLVGAGVALLAVRIGGMLVDRGLALRA